MTIVAIGMALVLVVVVVVLAVGVCVGIYFVVRAAYRRGRAQLRERPGLDESQAPPRV